MPLAYYKMLLVLTIFINCAWEKRLKKEIGWLTVMYFFSITCTHVCYGQDVEQQMPYQYQQQQQQCQIRLDYSASIDPNINPTKTMTSNMIGKFFIHNQNETDIQSWRLQFTFTDNERIQDQYDIFSKNVKMKVYRYIGGEFQNDVVLEWQTDNETNYIKKGGQAEVGWLANKDLTENNVTMSAPSQVQFNNLQNCTLTRQFDKLLYGYVGQEDAQIQVNYSTVIILNNKNQTIYTLPSFLSLKIRSISADVFNLKDLKLYYYFSGNPQSLERNRAEDYLIECIDSDDQLSLNCSKMTFNIQTNISSMYSARNVVEIGFVEGAGYLFDYNRSVKEQAYQVMENASYVLPSISVQFRIRCLAPFGILKNTNDYSYKFSPIEFQQAYENLTVAKREYVPNEKIPVFLNGTQIAGISPLWQVYQDRLNVEGQTDAVTQCTESLNSSYCSIYVVYCCTDNEPLIGDFLTIPDEEEILPPAPITTPPAPVTTPRSSISNTNISLIIIFVVIAALLCFTVACIRTELVKYCCNNGRQSTGSIPTQLENSQINIEGGQRGNLMEMQLQLDSGLANDDSLNSSGEQGQVKQNLLNQPEHHYNSMASLHNRIHVPLNNEQIGNSNNQNNSLVQDIHSGISGSLKDLIQRESQILENNKFNQTKNWWSALKIPEGIRDIPIIDLREVRPLGQGGFAMVYEVEFEDDAKLKYHDLQDKQLAVKIIYKEFIQIKHQMEAILQEVNVMKDLDSQYVVQLIGASLHIRPSLVMELVSQGSLESLIHNDGFRCNQTPLSWKLKLMLNISKGIQYLHSKGIIHRDLKPANILIQNAAEASIKISDFGISKITQTSSSIYTKNCFAGTRQYMAPEVCEEKITYKVDIWALGVIMQEIIRGVPPGKGQNDAQILMRLTKHEPPDNGELPTNDYPQNLCSLIRSCWHKTEERPSANEVVNKLDAVLQKQTRDTDRTNIASSEPKQSQF